MNPTTKLTSDIMTAIQSGGEKALTLAGVDRLTMQRLLLSPAFNQHCLKVSRELTWKLQGKPARKAKKR